MSTPQTTIYICSGVRLNSRYDHSISFDSVDAQESYFSGKVVKTLSAYSFVRKSWTLKVEATMEQAKTWNYLFFRNAATYKMYYYFIDNVEYINDSTVELTLKIDVIQTYLFNFTLLPSFVERQHTVTDEIGEHTVEEDLETGEFTSQPSYDLADLNTLCILVLSNVNPNSGNTVVGSMLNGVYSGAGLYAVNSDQWASFASLLSNLGSDTDGIINMWMYPKNLVELAENFEWDDTNVCKSVAGVISLDVTVKKEQSTVDDYTPTNKKLLTYPYNFLYMTNNTGNSAVYRYERFTNTPCEFRITGALSSEGSVHIAPQYYEGVPNNYDAGMTLGNFPTCAWNADVYKIWLAQNQNSQNLSLGLSGLTIAAGVGAGLVSLGTGNLIGAGASIGTISHAGSQIASQLAMKKDKAIQPPQSRGTFSANINVRNNKHTFTFYFKSVTAENARIIDDYFTMYGYKLNRVMTPNIKARPHFTYVKTLGCHIKGNLCNEDTVEIENIFDTGITFWRNGDNIANYSLDNTPA